MVSAPIIIEEFTAVEHQKIVRRLAPRNATRAEALVLIDDAAAMGIADPKIWGITACRPGVRPVHVSAARVRRAIATRKVTAR